MLLTIQFWVQRPQLIGQWIRREIKWAEFEKRFYQQIKKSPNATLLLKNICQTARKSNVTLLCKELNPQFCHRKILASICREIDPNLIIKHVVFQCY